MSLKSGLNIHYIQHVPFEGLGNIESWALSKGHTLSKTQLFDEETYPIIEKIDWLIIMGGPMNIYENQKYHWLSREKIFIEKVIKKGKFVTGICLGAQLIADVLGATVYKGKEKEIGWFSVTLTEEAGRSPLFNILPQSFTAFHWHGDLFEIPKSAKHIASSKGCENQAFEYQERVIALQFHLETTAESAKLLIERCGDELIEGKYIQTQNEMICNLHHFTTLQKNLNLFLDACERKIHTMYALF